MPDVSASTVSPEAIEFINQYNSSVAASTSAMQTKITIIAVCIVFILIVRGFLLDSKGFSDIRERFFSWWNDFKHMIQVISSHLKKKKYEKKEKQHDEKK